MKKMKNIRLIVLMVGAVLLFPAICNGFKFDVWQSGITLEEAEMLAEKESIQLQDALVDTVPQFEKQYTARLFNRPVVVRLNFTEHQSRLYHVTVRWEKGIEEHEVADFSEKIERILTKKYGRGKRLKGNTSSYRNGAKCHDQINGIFIRTIKDVISVYHSKKCELVVLSYMDDELKQLNEEYLKNSQNEVDDASRL